MKTTLSLIVTLVLGAFLLAPVVVSAQAGINLNYIQGYSNSIIGFINGVLVRVLFAIAFITFLWGVYKYYILGADSETEREKGHQFVLWGIIGFVIIISLWGIVNVFMGTLGLTTSNAPAVPTFGTGPTSNTSGGTQGASCTGNGQGTCSPGLTCVVVGEGYNACQ